MLKWDAISRPKHPHNRQGAPSTAQTTVWTITHRRKFAGKHSSAIRYLSIIHKLPDQRLPDRQSTPNLWNWGLQPQQLIRSTCFLQQTYLTGGCVSTELSTPTDDRANLYFSPCRSPTPFRSPSPSRHISTCVRSHHGHARG